MIQLGSKVKDKISGVIGTTIAKVEYLNGCVQYEIRPTNTKQSMGFLPTDWVDEEQLEIVAISNFIKKSPKTGGGKHVPPNTHKPPKQ